jgi:clan AA aspartic protease
MGTTTVKLKVKNPADPKLMIEEEFLVDSGASFTVLPKKFVRKLRLKPKHEQEFSLADGQIIRRKIGAALVNFRGKETASPVVLGEKDDTPLLGTLTLESLGLVLDPFQRKLYPAKLII